MESNKTWRTTKILFELQHSKIYDIKTKPKTKLDQYRENKDELIGIQFCYSWYFGCNCEVLLGKLP